METKSRYEVIADLEKQKRDLIRERDDSTDKINEKQREVKNLERTKEDISKQITDFDLQQSNEKADIDRKKADFDFKIQNTEDQIDRNIDDAKEDLKNYESTVDARKKTVEELIKGIDESLERFGKLQAK